MINTPSRCLVALAALTFAAACAPEAPKTTGAEKAAPAAVAAVTQGALAVSDPWIGATPAGSSVAAGYFVVSNAAETPDRLLAAESPRATRIEIHEMKMDGEMMQMRAVTGVDVPAQGAAVLAPGGLHLMLIGIDGPFVEGEAAPVTLTFEKAGRVALEMPVRPRTKAAGAKSSGGAHDGH